MYLLGWLYFHIPLTPMSQRYLTYIHSFNPIKLYPLIGYNTIIKIYNCSPIVQNIPFQTILSPFKTKDVIYCYTTPHLKAYQTHSNFLIITNNSPCKLLMKISDFWFSDSILQITNSFPTFYLNQ